ncbi:hypothetical protein TYRP_012813 [Tyrophagus putrescentiae]|nr:hypothetical protein TYRP_012813 [Tyrophagus putrescentiae]
MPKLVSRAAERLGYTTSGAATPTTTSTTTKSSRFRLVFEEDGTEVEDEAVFASVAKTSTADQTVFLLLRETESWTAASVDALKSALAAIPQIVCDTINSMALANKAPTWSIKDDQGFITVILQWEQLQQHQQDRLAYGLEDFGDEASWSASGRIVGPPSSYAQLSSPSSAGEQLKVYSSTFPRSRMRSTSAYASTAARRPTTTTTTTFWPPSATTFPEVPLPYKTLSADDFSLLGDHHHYRGLTSTLGLGLGGDDLTSSAHDLPSTANNSFSFCDFHCSSLHREGGSIRVSQAGGGVVPTHSVGTSPIPELLLAGGGVGVPAKKAGVHVRFLDLDNGGSGGGGGGGSRSSQQQQSSNISLLGQLLNGGVVHQQTASSGQQRTQILMERTPSSEESETETTEREEEQLRERYLLLVDSQLDGGGESSSRHLSIKDIGVILDRLRYKIVDVDRLEREKETTTVMTAATSGSSGSTLATSYNWLLRATIRGEMLREIGVVYNGQYYGLMEHPAYY